MSARIPVELAFNAPQFRAVRALLNPDGAVQRGRTIFLGFGRGVGKSWLLRTIWFLLVAAFDGKWRTEALQPFRGVRIRVLMSTLKQYKLVHWSYLEEELGPSGRWSFLGAKLDRQTGEIHFPGGSSIIPFPATEYNARTARGMRADVLCCDEVDDITAEVIDATATPWLSEPWSLGIQLIAGTPIRGRHGVWFRTLRAGKLGARLRAGESPEQVLGEEELEQFAAMADGSAQAVIQAIARIYAFHATYKDAPETIGQDAIARAIATTPAATFKREWLADPDAGEGLVYPFEESFHVREPPPGTRFQEILIGQDHGWTDPGVLIRAGVTGHGEDATLWLLDERYETEVPNDIWNERAREWRDGTFFPDPSRPDRINDLRAAGLRVAEVDNDIMAGIARVANLLFIREDEEGLRFARLYVSPRCKNVIREFGLYRRKKHPDGTFDEKPEDKNNHAMDCIRYMAVGRFGRMPNVRHSVSGR